MKRSWSEVCWKEPGWKRLKSGDSAFEISGFRLFVFGFCAVILRCYYFWWSCELKMIFKFDYIMRTGKCWWSLCSVVLGCELMMRILVKFNCSSEEQVAMRATVLSIATRINFEKSIIWERGMQVEHTRKWHKLFSQWINQRGFEWVSECCELARVNEWLHYFIQK